MQAWRREHNVDVLALMLLFLWIRPTTAACLLLRWHNGSTMKFGCMV